MTTTSSGEFDFYSWRFNLLCADSDWFLLFMFWQRLDGPDLTRRGWQGVKNQLFIYLKTHKRLTWTLFTQDYTKQSVNVRQMLPTTQQRANGQTDVEDETNTELQSGG